MKIYGCGILTIFPEFTKQLFGWFDEYGGETGRFRLFLGYHPITVICNPEDAEVKYIYLLGKGHNL